MDAINIYAVFVLSINSSGDTRKKLVCMFRTEKAAKGYVENMNEYVAGLEDPSSPYQYTVELWTVSGC